MQINYLIEDRKSGHHFCEDWDYIFITPASAEFSCCVCDLHEFISSLEVQIKEYFINIYKYELLFPLTSTLLRRLARNYNGDVSLIFLNLNKIQKGEVECC